jgi:hypothetical protein
MEFVVNPGKNRHQREFAELYRESVPHAEASKKLIDILRKAGML